MVGDLWPPKKDIFYLCLLQTMTNILNILTNYIVMKRVNLKIEPLKELILLTSWLDRSRSLTSICSPWIFSKSGHTTLSTCKLRKLETSWPFINLIITLKGSQVFIQYTSNTVRKVCYKTKRIIFSMYSLWWLDSLQTYTGFKIINKECDTFMYVYTHQYDISPKRT